MIAPLSAVTRPRVLALATLALLALARAGAAQGGEPLAGQVVDSAGKPVPDQHVTLHRVDRESGAMVDSAVTDKDGRFHVRLPAAPATDTSSLYFVATRWQGELYIGTPFKRPVPAGMYMVRVGVNPVQMGAAAGEGAQQGGAEQAQAPPPAPASSNAARWFLVAILALVGLGAVGYALLGRAREHAAHRRRVLLARIAELDERAALAPPDEAARLREERAEIVSELSSD